MGTVRRVVATLSAGRDPLDAFARIAVALGMASVAALTAIAFLLLEPLPCAA